MRRFLPVALMLIVWSARDADAQLLRPRLEISPYVGGFYTGELDVQDLANAPIFGARAGVRLPGGLGVEGQLGYSPLESEVLDLGDDREFDLKAWLYEAGLTYSLPLPGPLSPFLGVAAGQARFDPDLRIEDDEVDEETSLVVSVGGGLRLSLLGFRARADVRDHVVLDAFEELNEALGSDEGGELLHAVEASVGLVFLF